MTLFLGHAEPMQELDAAWLSTRFPHGWIFSGPSGIGKGTFAREVAAAILAASHGEFKSLIGETPAKNATRRMIENRAHPDLMILERAVDEKTGKLAGTLPVDAVRTIKDFFSLTPALSPYRVAILDGAEFLNRHGQNALLKILEEPPARAFLFLITALPGQLLPTLHSRCRELPFRRLADPEVSTILLRVRPEMMPDEAARLAEVAEGSIGLALRLAENGGLPLLSEGFECLCDASAAGQENLWAFCDRMGRKENADALETLIEVFLQMLARIISALAQGTHFRVRFPAEENAYRRLTAKFNLTGLLHLEAAIRTEYQRADQANLDFRLFLLHTHALLVGEGPAHGFAA